MKRDQPFDEIWTVKRRKEISVFLLSNFKNSVALSFSLQLSLPFSSYSPPRAAKMKKKKRKGFLLPFYTLRPKKP